MKLRELIETLDLTVKNNTGDLDAEVTAGYSSDLLSDVMANAGAGSVWITLQTHNNIVAVGVLKNLAAIILVNSREPDESTLEKAADEDLPILVSNLSTFDLVGKLYEMGIRGG